jgi:hypothetical protein
MPDGRLGPQRWPGVPPVVVGRQLAGAAAAEAAAAAIAAWPAARSLACLLAAAAAAAPLAGARAIAAVSATAGWHAGELRAANVADHAAWRRAAACTITIVAVSSERTTPRCVHATAALAPRVEVKQVALQPRFGTVRTVPLTHAAVHQDRRMRIQGGICQLGGGEGSGAPIADLAGRERREGECRLGLAGMSGLDPAFAHHIVYHERVLPAITSCCRHHSQGVTASSESKQQHA